MQTLKRIGHMVSTDLGPRPKSSRALHRPWKVGRAHSNGCPHPALPVETRTRTQAAKAAQGCRLSAVNQVLGGQTCGSSSPARYMALRPLSPHWRERTLKSAVSAFLKGPVTKARQLGEPGLCSGRCGNDRRSDACGQGASPSSCSGSTPWPCSCVSSGFPRSSQGPASSAQLSQS